MKDLNRIYNECYKEVVSCGIQPGNITDVSINTRATTRWGQCVKKDGHFTINISERLLSDNIPDDGLKNTIIHEILHTCKDCQNHGKEWKKYASIINERYGYKIKRADTAKEKGVSEDDLFANAKHKFTCTNCGNSIYRQRESKFTRNYTRYRCGICGGKLIMEY